MQNAKYSLQIANCNRVTIVYFTLVILHWLFCIPSLEPLIPNLSLLMPTTPDKPAPYIGLIGLAVMGENLALNIESRGYRVAVFNRTTSVVDEFIGRPGQGQERSSAATRSKSWSTASPRRAR